MLVKLLLNFNVLRVNRIRTVDHVSHKVKFKGVSRDFAILACLFSKTMYHNVWRIFPTNIFIYTILLVTCLPENVRSSPANYHQIPIRRIPQLDTINSYIMDTWSQYNNPEEGVHHQGDILISNTAKTIKMFKEQLWPYGIVYYTVDETMENNLRQLGIVQEAMQIIMGQTCVKFQRIYPDKNGRYPVKNWVHIIGNYSGCTSDLGRNPFGGPSILNLNVDTCFNVIGHALHELLHTLGIYHEHIRPDRDQHIDIIWDNIKDGNAHNFQLLDVNMVQDYGLPYDYDSVMHYSITAFSKDKFLPTIVPKISGKQIGQRDHLSYYDVQKLLITYECSQAHYFQNQLSYADENNSQKIEIISSNPINSTTDKPENVTTIAISTTEENLSEHSTMTTSTESSDKMDNVHVPTNNCTQAEQPSRSIKYYSINPNFVFVNFPTYNFYYYE